MSNSEREPFLNQTSDAQGFEASQSHHSNPGQHDEKQAPPQSGCEKQLIEQRAMRYKQTAFAMYDSLQRLRRSGEEISAELRYQTMYVIGRATGLQEAIDICNSQETAQPPFLTTALDRFAPEKDEHTQEVSPPFYPGPGL